MAANPTYPRILRRDEAAEYLGYPSAHGGFDEYIHRLGIAPLKSRKGCYDRAAIDAKLDEESGIARPDEMSEADRWLNEHDHD